MVWKSTITEDNKREFKELYSKGESTVTIGKMFNITDGTVRKYLKINGVNLRNKAEASKIAIEKGRATPPIPRQHKIPKSSKSLTKEKSYILGVLCGDGYISCAKGSGYQIGLQSIDKEFVNEFSNCIDKTYHLKAKESLIKVKNTKWNDKYQSRICSKSVFKDLQRYHKNFKTFEWRVPKGILIGSKNIQAKFLQGFFDSEGHVNYKGKNIIGVSANFGAIQEIKELLENCSIKSNTINYKTRNLKGILISGRGNIEIFNKKINFIIARKRENLKKLLSSYKRYCTPHLEIKKMYKKMVFYRKKGLSYLKISKKLNISRSAVWNHINRFNVN